MYPARSSLFWTARRRKSEKRSQTTVFSLPAGVAHTAGLETYIEEMIGIRCRTALEPDICSVTGLKKIIESPELRKLAYSMIEENYRWMR